MSTPFLKTITVTAVAAPLTAARTALKFATISAPPSNAGAVRVTDPAGGYIDLVAGQWEQFTGGIDLALLSASGADGDVLVVTGGG